MKITRGQLRKLIRENWKKTRSRHAVLKTQFKILENKILNSALSSRVSRTRLGNIHSLTISGQNPSLEYLSIEYVGVSGGKGYVFVYSVDYNHPIVDFYVKNYANWDSLFRDVYNIVEKYMYHWPPVTNKV
jgi:hypothetical protein